MEKKSKELLQLELKTPSSSTEAALLICGNTRNSQEEKTRPDGKFVTEAPSKSQVLDRVKGFLGVISEANRSLQLNAEDKPNDYNIEVLRGDEAEYIEMDLMLGVADLHTPEAVAAAEAAIAGGKQPILDLQPDGSSSESESSSDEDEHMNDSSPKNQQSRKEENDSLNEKPKYCPKSKRPKIVELS